MVYELSWAKSSVPHVINYTVSLFHPFTLSPVRTPKVSHRGAPILKIRKANLEKYSNDTVPTTFRYEQIIHYENSILSSFSISHM